MRRLTALALVVLLCACSSGSDKPSGFLEQWSHVPAGPDYKGHATRVDEKEQVVYIDDCELAREATKEGGPFAGMGYICPS